MTYTVLKERHPLVIEAMLNEQIYLAIKGNWIYHNIDSHPAYHKRGKKIFHIYNDNPQYVAYLQESLRNTYNVNKHITLYRGIKSYNDNKKFYNKFCKKRKGSTIRLGKFNGISLFSWTDKLVHAEYFSNWRGLFWNAIIFEAQIPIQKILWSGRILNNEQVENWGLDDYVHHEFIVDHANGIPCKIIRKRLRKPKLHY